MGVVGSRAITTFSPRALLQSCHRTAGRRSGPLVSAQVVLSYPISGRYSGPLAGAQVAPFYLLHTGKCSWPLVSARLQHPPPLQLQNLFGLNV